MGVLLRVTKPGERCDKTSLQERHSHISEPANPALPDESEILIKLRLDYDYGGLRSPFQPTAEKKKQAVPFRGPIPALPRRLEIELANTRALPCRTPHTSAHAKSR